MGGIKSAIGLGVVLVLLLGALPALADQKDGRYELPDHSLAAGDEIGMRLFDRNKHVVLRPKHEEQLKPDVKRAPNELPPWPAKWAPASDEDE